MSQNAQQLSLTAIAELPAIAPLPEQEISTEVLVEKYAKGGERSAAEVRGSRTWSKIRAAGLSVPAAAWRSAGIEHARPGCRRQ